MCASPQLSGDRVRELNTNLPDMMLSYPQGSATRAMGVVPSTNQFNETCLALGLQIPRDKITKKENPRREPRVVGGKINIDLGQFNLRQLPRA